MFKVVDLSAMEFQSAPPRVGRRPRIEATKAEMERFNPRRPAWGGD